MSTIGPKGVSFTVTTVTMYRQQQQQEREKRAPTRTSTKIRSRHASVRGKFNKHLHGGYCGAEIGWLLFTAVFVCVFFYRFMYIAT